MLSNFTDSYNPPWPPLRSLNRPVSTHGEPRAESSGEVPERCALASEDSLVCFCQLSRSQGRKAKHGAGGEGDTRHPGSSGPLPLEGLASAGTSGLHRRWSLGGNSPQPGLAKTCDPNVDPWPRWLRLPSSGPRSTHRGAGRCLLPFSLIQHTGHWETFTEHLPGLGPHTGPWEHVASPHA